MTEIQNNGSTIEYTDAPNDIIGSNSLNFINDRRTFNQWTDIHSDNCEYKQLLNLATKPMEYYVNSLNNTEGTNNPNLSFTPIGQAQVEFVPNMFDRPIPSILTKNSSTYTTPYSTSPFLGMQNVSNPLATDEDIILKAGLTMRNKLNDLSSRKFPNFGDINIESNGTLYNNAGQFFGLDNQGNRVLSNSMNIKIPGLNEQQSIVSQGTGAIWPDYSGHTIGVDTRQILLNYQNGSYDVNKKKNFKKILKNN